MRSVGRDTAEEAKDEEIVIGFRVCFSNSRGMSYNTGSRCDEQLGINVCIATRDEEQYEKERPDMETNL